VGFEPRQEDSYVCLVLRARTPVNRSRQTGSDTLLRSMNCLSVCFCLSVCLSLCIRGSVDVSLCLSVCLSECVCMCLSLSVKDQDSTEPEPSDWERYAAEEYELLVAEEGATDAQHDDASVQVLF